jgi:uncharacterized Fe-S cluster-containing radical SAM superfamily protein
MVTSRAIRVCWQPNPAAAVLIRQSLPGGDMSGGPESAAVRRAHELIHVDGVDFSLTDLTKTGLGGVQNRFFRLFEPVKTQRLRLPTTLPEFSGLRHCASLSDSPVTAAAKLGGFWTDYNAAAICHVAACNLRCTYCYVERDHLSGRDSFTSSPSEIVAAFLELPAPPLGWLSILRISGGEPLLAPELVLGVAAELQRRNLERRVLLKVESNLSAFAYSASQMSAAMRQELSEIASMVTLHATLHVKPNSPLWRAVQRGMATALALGMDLYPAIGGADWSRGDMESLLRELWDLSPNLPLRLAVRPFRLDYPSLLQRRHLPERDSDGAPSEVWERILMKRYGVPYLGYPRHEVGLG